MTRPASIVAYERLYLAGLGASLLGWYLTWPAMRAQIAANPATAAHPWTLGMTLAILAAATLALWYFTARRASLIAKWLVVLFAGFGVVRLFLNLPAALAGRVGPITFTVATVTAILFAIAAGYLFAADARAWFGEAPQDEDMQGGDMQGGEGA